MAKKKIKKKTPLWLLFKPKQVGKGGEREKTKIVFPFCSYPTGNIKFQKKRKRIKKIKKYHCGFVSCQNRLEKEEKERKQKLSFRSVPTQREIQNSKKNRKKIKKIPLWLHFLPKQVGKCREREKIKIAFPFPSDRTGNRKF